ncbi:MAG TPA: PDGLE domain-containing protein [Acidimicrobiia bacterium]
MRKGLALFGIGLLISLLIATVISQFASSQPDGLNYVAEQQGFGNAAEDHALDASPLAGYGGDSPARKAAAGAVGVLATLGLGYLVFYLVKSDKSTAEE